MADIISILNGYARPTLLMQAEPRQVVTANQKACDLFGKNLEQIEGKRGGQVFDCIHSFSEAGCGVDLHCEGCKIKEAIVDTLLTGTPHGNVATFLEIKKPDTTTTYVVEVSIRKVGDHAFVTIEKYEQKLS